MSQKLLIGTRKGLFFLSRDQAGKPWKKRHAAFLGAPASMVLPDRRDGSIYVALSHGHFGVKLHRSDDQGNNWVECGVPAYGKSEADPKSLDYIWALETADPAAAGTVWCGTVPGGLFRSDDRGASWRLNESLWNNPKRKEWMGGGMEKPGIHSICVEPGNPKHVMIGVSCGGVWETRDGGETWNCRADGMIARYMPPDQQQNPNIQDAHRLVQSPVDPRVLWVQHHSGMFHTADGAASWHELTAQPSTFGFAVAAHPRDAATAWFVPGVSDELRYAVDGKMVVTRTRDGGKSFEQLRDGLPQEDAYHLVFRHGLDVDSTGKCLAFGSTTGSLWTTDDGGDSWQRFSADLPPIYCVRFSEN